MQQGIPFTPPAERSTTRLQLREVNPAVLRWLLHSSTSEQQTGFVGIQSPKALHSLLTRMREELMRTDTISFRHWFLVEKNTGQVIGNCGFQSWHKRHQRAELGYGLRADQWKRRGFMTEALECILAIGFNEMGLERIEAFIDPDNVPSLKLVQHFGFGQEGLLQARIRHRGDRYPLGVFALLRNDYFNHRRRPVRLRSRYAETVRAFWDRTLPAGDWTHEAHLLVSLWQIRNYTFEEALYRLRVGIILYNQATGTPNTIEGGYHETRTVFYLHTIRAFAATLPQGMPFSEAGDRLLASPVAGQRFIFQYYRPECLAGSQAASQWVEPDLQPLEFSFR